MAAINFLAQTKTYPKTIDSAFVLSQRGSLTTLHWVSNHISIEGNERADTLANEATIPTNILHAEQTPGAYKNMLTEFLQNQIRPNSDFTKLSSWYNKTIVPDVQLINNGLADIHILRLRC